MLENRKENVVKENRDTRQPVSTEETVPEAKPEKKKKTSIVFKIWAALVVVLAFLAGSLIAQEHALHESWEKEEQQIYDSIDSEITELGTEAEQEHTAGTDTDCRTASAAKN